MTSKRRAQTEAIRMVAAVGDTVPVAVSPGGFAGHQPLHRSTGRSYGRLTGVTYGAASR